MTQNCSDLRVAQKVARSFLNLSVLIKLEFLQFSVSGKKQSIGNKPQRYRAQPNLDVQSTSPEENVPSYMRSTSASAKKERPVSAASASVQFPQTPRRRSSFGQTQSTLDLRSTALDDDSSSEENMQRSLKGRRRSSSHDR